MRKPNETTQPGWANQYGIVNDNLILLQLWEMIQNGKSYQPSTSAYTRYSLSVTEVCILCTTLQKQSNFRSYSDFPFLRSDRFPRFTVSFSFPLNRSPLGVNQFDFYSFLLFPTVYHAVFISSDVM